ncbi:MAG TPA: DUF5995 family protein [Streptosporangiaceae bacterium]|nr:DUF5995 family protein [Streptosporangiaceae bacterium]
MSIEALIRRMEALLGPLEAVGDPQRFFHASYLRTTRALRDALRAGLLHDPDWVERWGVAFADRYLAALGAAAAGAAVPAPWAVAFRAGQRQPGAPALRPVLLSMSAHISYDLPQALLAVISGPEFANEQVISRRHADYQRIGELLSRWWFPGGLNQPASRRLRAARAAAWANAIELNAARSLGPPAYAERQRDLEALSAARVAGLVRRGQLRRLALPDFGVRLVAEGDAVRRTPYRANGTAPAGPAGPPAAGRAPGRLRSFDPAQVAGLELRAWVGYYRRDWATVLRCTVALVRAGFGMSWPRTVQGAWLLLRASQLWAPLDNDPEAAQRCLRQFYGLVGTTYGTPGDSAEAARLEVEWWRVHRERQHGFRPAEPLVDALARLYAFVYQAPHSDVRPAAAHRARAMDLSDQWVAEGCLPDSPLLALEHAALVRSYAALLAAVHR